jgi:hypothetical protein
MSTVTVGPSIHSFLHNGKTVHLIDTPGFNDAGRSELDVFKEIVFWLSSAHTTGIHLNGIVYLHCIAAPRWAASCAKSTSLLKAFCGAENYSSVVLATTHWSSVSADIGNKRHQELSESQDMWGPLKEGGAVVYPHSAGKVSAMKIVSHLMKLPKCILAVQKEMESPDKKLSDTKAGQQIIQLWGEELSASEEEIKKQMELQLVDFDQQRTENIKELRQTVRMHLSYVTDAQVSRKQLHDEWQARNTRQLQTLRQELEINKRKVKEMTRLSHSVPHAQQMTKELELLKARTEELNRLQMSNIAARSLNVGKGSLYFTGLSAALTAAVGIVPLVAACVLM